MFWKKLLQASESWVAVVGAVLPFLPIKQATKDGLIYPIWTYVVARVTSKAAKAVVK